MHLESFKGTVFSRIADSMSSITSDNICALFTLCSVYTVKCKTHCNLTETSPHVTSFTPASSAAVLVTSSSSSGFIMTDLNPKQTTVTSAACLNRVCQVIVRAHPGQRLNITLLDFTLEEEERNQLRHQLHGVETCYRYIRSLMLLAQLLGM